MSLVSRMVDLATRAATEAKALRTLINGNAADLSSLTTTAKSNVVAALNEVAALARTAQSSGGAQINDTTASPSTVYSASKTDALIAATTAALVNSSPAALDTLKELADALGNDANFAATTAAALGYRLRFDASQTLTSGQQAQGQTNLGVTSATAIGDTTTNFVQVYEAGLS